MRKLLFLLILVFMGSVNAHAALDHSILMSEDVKQEIFGGGNNGNLCSKSLSIDSLSRALMMPREISNEESAELIRNLILRKIEKQSFLGLGEIPIKMGVGVVLSEKDHPGWIWMGQRKSRHGQGTFGVPGGALEPGETVFDCARREVSEETGVRIGRLRLHAVTRDFFEAEQKISYSFHLEAEIESGVPHVVEPEKVVSWNLYDWSQLPSPIFLTVENLRKLGWMPSQMAPNQHR